MRDRPLSETLLFVLSGLLVGLYASLLFPISRASDDAHTIVVNVWRAPAYLLTLGTSVVAILLAIWAGRRTGRPPALPLAMALAAPLFCGLGAWNDFRGYSDDGLVRDADGTEYHLLMTTIGNGSQLAMGRLRRRVGPIETFDVLAFSPWEEWYGCLCVVRPEGAPEDRTMVLTSDRLVVGIPYRNVAFLAYDLKTGKVYSQILDGEKNGDADIRELSPFLLIGPNDVPRGSDFQTLLDPDNHGRPFPGPVERDLANANPRVAELAERLLPDLRAHPVDR